MNLPPQIIVVIPMAAAIVVFFWSLDRIRKERIARPLTPAMARATPRELVERLLRPAAENLSQRRRAGGAASSPSTVTSPAGAPSFVR